MSHRVNLNGQLVPYLHAAVSRSHGTKRGHQGTRFVVMELHSHLLWAHIMKHAWCLLPLFRHREFSMKACWFTSVHTCVLLPYLWLMLKTGRCPGRNPGWILSSSHQSGLPCLNTCVILIAFVVHRAGSGPKCEDPWPSKGHPLSLSLFSPRGVFHLSVRLKLVWGWFPFRPISLPFPPALPALCLRLEYQLPRPGCGMLTRLHPQGPFLVPSA